MFQHYDSNLLSCTQACFQTVFRIAIHPIALSACVNNDVALLCHHCHMTDSTSHYWQCMSLTGVPALCGLVGRDVSVLSFFMHIIGREICTLHLSVYTTCFTGVHTIMQLCVLNIILQFQISIVGFTVYTFVCYIPFSPNAHVYTRLHTVMNNYLTCINVLYCFNTFLLTCKNLALLYV